MFEKKKKKIQTDWQSVYMRKIFKLEIKQNEQHSLQLQTAILKNTCRRQQQRGKWRETKDFSHFLHFDWHFVMHFHFNYFEIENENDVSLSEFATFEVALFNTLRTLFCCWRLMNFYSLLIWFSRLPVAFLFL